MDEPFLVHRSNGIPMGFRHITFMPVVAHAQRHQYRQPGPGPIHIDESRFVFDDEEWDNVLDCPRRPHELLLPPSRHAPPPPGWAEALGRIRQHYAEHPRPVWDENVISRPG